MFPAPCPTHVELNRSSTVHCVHVWLFTKCVHTKCVRLKCSCQLHHLRLHANFRSFVHAFFLFVRSTVAFFGTCASVRTFIINPNTHTHTDCGTYTHTIYICMHTLTCIPMHSPYDSRELVLFDQLLLYVHAHARARVSSVRRN